MAKVQKIEPKKAPELRARKKVAAYARVSMACEQLEHSLAAQISYYNELIQKNPDWEFAGVYSDDGISGTSITSRRGFQQMIEDADAGKIDIILTKSISRFARNTVDLLQTVRHLKEKGISVRFEREHIDTLSSDGEFMLTILASYAQEESRSTSENLKWAVRKGYEEGRAHGHPRIYGYRWDGNEYSIEPSEAEVVRRIFEEGAAGNSPGGIARGLKADGIVGMSGKPMIECTVRLMLKNQFYAGTTIFQKSFTTNPKEKKRNYGELPMYMTEDGHPAIITQELFDKAAAAQEERGRNASKRMEPTCFSGRVVCGDCGYSCCRRHLGSRKKTGMVIIRRWACNGAEKKGKEFCNMKPLDEDDLRRMAAEALGEETLDDDEFRRQVEKVTIYGDRVEFRFFSGRVKKVARSYQKLPGGRSCFTSRIVCGECGTPVQRRELRRVHSNPNSIYKIWDCDSRRKLGKHCSTHWIEEDELREATAEILGDRKNYESRFVAEVKQAVLFNDRLEFHMRNGEVRTWHRR